MAIEPRRQSSRRRSTHDIRQDLASAVRALYEHAKVEGRLREQAKYSGVAQLLNAQHLKAEAEHCADLERWIMKYFNSVARPGRATKRGADGNGNDR